MKPTKTPLFLLVPFLLALLAGCGAEGDSTSTASTSQSAATEANAAPRPKPAKGGAEEPSAKSRRSSQQGLTDPNPLPNEGAAAVAPSVPTAKGGDNSIQSYGLEADSAERVAVARLVKGYLGAEAAGRWAAACADLSVVIRSKFRKAAEATPNLKAKGCADTFAALLAKTPRRTLRDGAQIHVLSLRVKDTQAFIIYRDASGKPFNLPLRREGGEWKVSAPLGIELVL
jgi:hypothetical protein